MIQIKKDFQKLFGSKGFCVGLVLMMVLSYATLLHQPTVGIDDTAFDIYYEEGVSPAMGRWCLYVINKFFPLAYNPYFVEGIGLLLFCLSVGLWCLVFYRILGDRIPNWGYLLFGAAFLSSPMLSEVVVWYLQDGIYLGYGFTALSVLCMGEAMGQSMNERKASVLPCTGKCHMQQKKNGMRIQVCATGAKWLLGSIGFLTIAMGFYEAFMIVFLEGCFMSFFMIRSLHEKLSQKEKKIPGEKKGHQIWKREPWGWLWRTGVCAVLAVVLRMLINEGMIAIFHLQEETKVLRSRGLHEVLGWFNASKTWDDFAYVMKDFFVKYYVDAIVYVPVMILVLSIGCICLAGLILAIRKKDIWIFLAVLGIVLTPWVMPVLEGVATYYRSSQYVPLVTGFGVLVTTWGLLTFLEKRPLWKCRKIVSVFAFFAAAMLLYRQAYEMNKWFYVDACKYENDKRVMYAVAQEIQENCDAAKPVCVIGNYQTPESIRQKAICPSWSKKYTLVRAIVSWIDEDLFAAYDTPDGYLIGESPHLSFINWGATAFYHFDRQLIKFWAMHGITLYEDGNLTHYEDAKELMENGPVWPQKGSIVEMEDYIIVNFGSNDFAIAG